MGSDVAPAPWGANLGRALDDLGDEVPPPPYQIRGVTSASIGACFDPDAVRSLLPRALSPTPAVSGGFLTYTCQSGGGIAPYSCSLTWIDVERHDSPDGSKGRFIIRGFYSGRAAIALGRMLASCGSGVASIAESRDLIVATGGRDDEEFVRFTLRPSGQPRPTSAGVHYWIGEDPLGAPVVVPVAFSYEAQSAEPIAVEIRAPLGENVALLRPRRLVWAAFFHSGAITLHKQSPLGDLPAIEAAASRERLMELIGRLGGAAFVIDDGLRLISCNAEAERLLGDGFDVHIGLLRPSVNGDDKPFRAAVSAALARDEDGAGTPLAIRRNAGGKPLIVRVMALGVRPAGAALVLATDPERPVAADATAALQLLGLTPAEARVAALVGSGISPKDAAHQLGNAEGTIRATLNQVYSKLAISRQSELAVLVSRISLPA